MSDQAVVQLEKGTVRGVTLDGVIVWRGIPYAAPPLGGQRWKPPAPHVGWTDVLDASTFGPRAIQPHHEPFRTAAVAPVSDDPTNQDEDCLVLNVTASITSSPDEPQPVFVWFHGGGFHVGSGPAFGVGDGVELAKSGIIVVTVNYRVGALGFLKVADRLSENPDDYAQSANLGLLDQAFALEWVRDNIAPFGGDPDRVTIGGLSAGAKSVVNHLVLPQSRGLFHGVFSESGGDYQATPDQMDAVADAFFEALNAEGWSPERALEAPAEAILAAQRRLGEGGRATWIWRPGLDGVTMHERVAASLDKGLGAQVPLLAGTTRRETFTYQLRDPSAVNQIPAVARDVFGESADDILRLYRDRLAGDETEALHAFGTDERYAVDTERVLDAQSACGPTWGYRFDGSTPGWPSGMRAIHASDLPMFWRFGLENASDIENALSERMHTALVNFIHHGEPGHPDWPQYTAPARAVHVFDDDDRTEVDEERPERAAWRGVSWKAATWWPIQAPPEATVSVKRVSD